MEFKHHCYTEAEAQEEERSLRARLPDLPLVLGRWSRAGVATVLTMVFGTVGLIGFTIADSVLGTTLAIVGGVLAILTFVARLVVGEWDEAYERERREDLGALRRASNRDLEWLVGEGKKHPEVAEVVRSWVTEGKVVRERDIWAVGAYLFEAEPIKAREALLAELS